MSPEQVEPSAVVDVRTDVFSLGVIAFELLGGQVPVVPPKSGLATLQALKKAPAPRLRTVAPTVAPELDAIVARALEVNPERRYGSVAELGDDLRRFLAHEPVRAFAGGQLYRLGRFVRRNRLATGAALAVVLSLSAGVGVSVTQYLQAERARKVAATEAERATSSLEFLTGVLQEADADNAGGRGATIGQALDGAVARLSKGELDPHVEATLRASLANTYVGLGEWAHATEQATLALAAYQTHHLDDDEQLGEVLRVVSEVRIDSADPMGAVEAGDQALALEQKLHGTGAHPHVSESFHVAATAQRENGEYARAVATHQQAIAMERVLLLATHQTQDLADSLDQYGLTLGTMGRFDEARAAHDEALALNIAAYGPDHQTPAIGYHHHGWLEVQAGNDEVARGWLDKALTVRLKTLGPDHMRIGMQRNAEALVELDEGHVEKAAWAIDECLRIAQKAYGENLGRTARLMGTKVQVLVAQGATDEALSLSERLVTYLEGRFGPGHALVAEAHSNHALVLLALGRREAARTELEAAEAVLDHLFPDGQARPKREVKRRLAKARAS
jgi:tetratricopeptide (TPR) repeat protein